MTEFVYILCGLSAGVLGGYLGLGGGVVMVPFMTLLMGLDIKEAVPVSVAAITINSVSASREYLKKGLVDVELSLTLAVFTVLGFITGSLLIEYVPGDALRLIFSACLLYTAYSFMRKKAATAEVSEKSVERKFFYVSVFLTFLTGVLSALIGIGGGLVMVPVLFLLFNLPLTTIRGTWSFTYGFAAAASTAVYFFMDRIDLTIVPPVIVGIIVGGKIGGFLGTLAKPAAVKIIFFVLLLYTAFKLGYGPLMELL